MHVEGSYNQSLNFMLPSKWELDNTLKDTIQKINSTAESRLAWPRVILPLGKEIFKSIIKEPTKSAFKIIFTMGAGYINYLLIRGVFAGIEVDIDSNFMNLFSSDKETRLNEGLNLTNGEQAGQFLIDGLALAYCTYQLIVRQPYNKVAAIINLRCFKPYLKELYEEMIEKKTKNESNNYIQKKQEFDHLYQYLEKKLDNLDQTVELSFFEFIKPDQLEKK